MKTKHFQLLLVALFTLPFLFSCNRHDDEDVAPTKTELLTAHVWQGEKVFLMGLDVTNNEAIPPNAPDVRTLQLTFRPDHTYLAESDVLTFEGEWRFNEDETKIYFDFLALGEVDIKELTNDSFQLGTSVSKDQLTLLAQLLNLSLGPLTKLPDGTEIEAEIRFVKP
ncbi:hypothetical protein GCM10023188_29520 [Pontibacter saemangeumensis]|uniref:Lipocalin-like domain-containing protein n=1 Tax=Pontibacter saemangeumensis TaxID=1084525 RepID=A0ABP8LTG2_9BACT